MAHLVLDVAIGPDMAPAVAAVVAGLGPPIPPADGNVDPPVADPPALVLSRSISQLM